MFKLPVLFGALLFLIAWGACSSALGNKGKRITLTDELNSENACELKNTARYIQTGDGRYLVHTAEGKLRLDKEEKTFFQVAHSHDGKIFLKSARGGYLSIKPNGKHQFSETPSGWEAFEPWNMGLRAQPPKR